MLKDPALVFEKAEETAQKYHECMEAEQKSRKEAANNIVLGLGDLLDELGINGGDDVTQSDRASADPELYRHVFSKSETT